MKKKKNWQESKKQSQLVNKPCKRCGRPMASEESKKIMICADCRMGLYNDGSFVL